MFAGYASLFTKASISSKIVVKQRCRAVQSLQLHSKQPHEKNTKLFGNVYLQHRREQRVPHLLNRYKQFRRNSTCESLLPLAGNSLLGLAISQAMPYFTQ